MTTFIALPNFDNATFKRLAVNIDNAPFNPCLRAFGVLTIAVSKQVKVGIFRFA
jgi:hypothetical protein